MKKQSEMSNVCLDCYYAREREDICGIYCVGAYFKQEDGTCEHWRHYKVRREKKPKDERL